jgi:adenine-specific DNA-methyltransferase
MNSSLPQVLESIILGDCINVMGGMPGGSFDLILTDPPYLANYRERSGRLIANDRDDAWLFPAFREMHRVLKPDSLAVSFYGWHKADAFMGAWREAGFGIVGHIVFRKPYASSSRFLRYQHESAYLLAKGRPPFPEAPPPDVLDWQYTGNRHHPTQKPVKPLMQLIRAFTTQGAVVLDPFAGSGSTLVAAHKSGRRFVGIELDEAYHRAATDRLSRLGKKAVTSAA